MNRKKYKRDSALKDLYRRVKALEADTASAAMDLLDRPDYTTDSAIDDDWQTDRALWCWLWWIDSVICGGENILNKLPSRAVLEVGREVYDSVGRHRKCRDTLIANLDRAWGMTARLREAQDQKEK
jgi:hypothetical protein